MEKEPQEQKDGISGTSVNNNFRIKFWSLKVMDMVVPCMEGGAHFIKPLHIAPAIKVPQSQAP